MNGVNWLLESNCFDDEKKLLEEIERQGMTCKIASYRAFEEQHGYLDLFDEKACVVYHGGLGFSSQVKREAPLWVPGVYANLTEFQCTHYYPALAQYSINERYAMYPYGELIRQKELIFEQFGIDDAVFVRPNSGAKVFTGTLIFKEKYENQIEKLSFYDVKHHELCVVSEPRNIEAEWRFVVVNKRVVAGSQYQLNGKHVESPTWPQEAFDLAQEIAQKYQPDPAWTVDICRVKSGQYKMMEIGSFGCAGLYACDLPTVVREVSAAALEEWKSYHIDS